MKPLLLVAVAGLVCGLAHARPLIIEETSRIESPDATLSSFGGRVAVDGNDAIVTGQLDVPGPYGFDSTYTRVYLYRRVGVNWIYVRQIAEDFDVRDDASINSYGIAMRDGVAALSLQPFKLFEKRSGNWVPVTYFNQYGTPDQLPEEGGEDVEIESGRIFAGNLNWGGHILQKDTAGVWRVRQRVDGDWNGIVHGANGGPVDISPNWAVVADPFNGLGLPEPAVHIFRNIGTDGWLLDARMDAVEGHTIGEVALGAEQLFFPPDHLFVEDFPRFGVARFERQLNGSWQVLDWLRTAGDLMSTPEDSSSKRRGTGLKVSEPYVFHRVWNHDRHAWVVNVFLPNFLPNGNVAHEHVGTLAASNGESLGGSLAVSGRRVLVAGDTQAYYFLLPSTFATPALIQDTFEIGNRTGWSPLGGSQFAVVQSGSTRVYRQSSTAGNAGALLIAANWKNQSIQMDVKPTAFGADGWVGLATRRIDDANYYFVALRGSGVLSINRVQNGALVPLASRPYPGTPNRNYRLRLESIGTQHRVYIDGSLVLDADDAALTIGRPALLTSNAAADFDNVAASPTPTATIYAQASVDPLNPGANAAPWSYDGAGNWIWSADGAANTVLAQTSIAATTRAAVGPLPWTLDLSDQVVEVRARARTFGAGAPWLGLAARYVDANNYVHLMMRGSNRLSLRKVVNGNVVELGTVVQNATPGIWYRLRLETIGTQVRAYVNGKLLIEAVDPQPSIGRIALDTQNTLADFDDIRAIQP